MKIVADENLSLTEYFFAPFGSVTTHPGRQMNADVLRDAEALLVRSVTKVTPQLLFDAGEHSAHSDAGQSRSCIGFVGSATIGVDHLDVEGLQVMGVTVANAPGCNAEAVAEYVVTAILTLRPELSDGRALVLGIVGLGNVGRRLAKVARRLGWEVIGVDPLVSVSELDITQMSLVEMLPQADVVSLHVPLTRDGAWPTYHLINIDMLARMKPHAMLINSARGPVVEEAALLHDLAQTPRRPVVLDVFEHEPRISSQLLDRLALATPHIAGYSLEGKARGTEMIYQAFCRWRGEAVTRSLTGMLPSVPQLLTPSETLLPQLLANLSELYPIKADDLALRACLRANDDGKRWVDAQDFDRLRRDYPLRREWAAYGDQSCDVKESQD